uniref:Uncharacterized protein n=1 Tax=Ditylenchus dipsaci TaxID=166011 RepID=A0A915DRM3_9BILA
MPNQQQLSQQQMFELQQQQQQQKYWCVRDILAVFSTHPTTSSRSNKAIPCSPTITAVHTPQQNPRRNHIKYPLFKSNSSNLTDNWRRCSYNCVFGRKTSAKIKEVGPFEHINVIRMFGVAYLGQQISARTKGGLKMMKKKAAKWRRFLENLHSNMRWNGIYG